jgi:hypothetical protein
MRWSDPRTLCRFESRLRQGVSDARPGDTRAESGVTSTELEVLLRQDAIAQHIPWTRLQRVLRQQPLREVSSGLPDSWIQAGVETREAGP